MKYHYNYGNSHYVLVNVTYLSQSITCLLVSIRVYWYYFSLALFIYSLKVYICYVCICKRKKREEMGGRKWSILSRGRNTLVRSHTIISYLEEFSYELNLNFGIFTNYLICFIIFVIIFTHFFLLYLQTKKGKRKKKLKTK